MAQQSKSRSGSSRSQAKTSVAELARKGKVPAIAVGAGLAGLAGGTILGRRTASNSVGDKLGEVARSVGGLGEGVGSFAAEMRKVREGVAAAGNGDRSPSPIEVVLQGLTRRRRFGEP